MILKFQQGGVPLPPLVSYQPVTVTGGTGVSSATADTTSSSKSSSGDLTDKDILTMLKDIDGLPNDMAAITKSLRDFQINQQYSLFPNTSSIQSEYLQTLNQLKIANFFKKEYDNAYNMVKDNGAINEIAINDKGQMIVKDSNGDYQLVTPEQFYANKGDYTPLTNQDLLSQRAYSADTTFNNSLLGVVKNGTSMKAIYDNIKEVINNLGSVKNEREGMVAKEGQNVLAGVSLLKEAAKNGQLQGDELSIDGMYKAHILTESQSKQAINAINYIYQALPENDKALLKFKAGGSQKGMMNLLTNLVTSRTSNTFEFSLDYQENVNADGTKKSEKKEKDDSPDINAAMALAADMGEPTTMLMQNGTMDALTIQGNAVPAVSKDGKNIGITTLDKIASDTVMGGMLDFNQITMGGQTMDASSAQNIQVTGSSLMKAYLPIDKKKQAQGITAPDFDALQKLEAVRNEIKRLPANQQQDNSVINSIYEKHGLNKFVDVRTGQVDPKYYAPFAVMQGVALSDAFNRGADLSGIEYLQEITDGNEIQSAWKTIKGKDTKEKFDKKGVLDYLGFGSYQQMFKGLVFLPMSTNINRSALSGGATPSANELNDWTMKTIQAKQHEDRLQNFKSAGQLQL